MIGFLALAFASLLSGSPLLPAGAGWKRYPLGEGGAIATAVADGDGIVAAGLSHGGVLLIDPARGRRSSIQGSAFGARGRILSLEWVGADLWIASEAGLHRQASAGAAKSGVATPAAALRSGVRALFLQSDVLWCATVSSVLGLSPRTGEVRQEWRLPQEVDPTSLLRVGGRTFVGTSASGLMLLDSATGAWTHLGRAEGLSSDQVTGLEWSGGEVFVSTPEGIDVVDLSTQKLRPLASARGAFWLAQVHGVLLASGPEGLQSADPREHRFRPVSLPASVRPDGAVAAGGGLVAVGAGNEILIGAVGGLLGDDPPRLDPAGFRFRLPAPLAQGIELKAWLRLPEWPAARFELVVEPAESLWCLVRTPPDLRGSVLLDLVASGRDGVEEMRSVEGMGDRTRPVLDASAPPAVVKDSLLVVSGAVSGVGALRLVLQPEGRELSLSPDGRFKGAVALVPGANRFALSLSDGLGFTTLRAWMVTWDNRPPVVAPVVPDTVAGDFARLRVPFADATPVVGTVSWPGRSRVSVLDSFVVVEAGGLVVGDNRIPLELVDQGGNRTSVDLPVFRRSAATVFDTSLASPDDLLAVQPPWAGTGAGAVHIVHYRMLEGETICEVAEKFYGSQGLAPVLIRWNGFADSSQWRRMPVGTPMDVPFWTDFEFGRMEMRDALATFPWALVPARPRSRR